MSGLVASTSAVVIAGIITGSATGLGEDVFSIDGRETDGDEGGVLSFTGGESGFFSALTGITGTTTGAVCSTGDGVLFFSLEGELFRLGDNFNGTTGTTVGELGPGEEGSLTGEGDFFFGDGEGDLDLTGFVSLSFITAPPTITAEAGTTLDPAESGFGLGVFSLGCGIGGVGVLFLTGTTTVPPTTVPAANPARGMMLGEFL